MVRGVLLGWMGWMLVMGCNESSGTGPSAATSGSANVALPGVAAPSAAPSASTSAPDSEPVAQSKPPDTIIAQHVLVAYKGSKRTPRGVTRSKFDARARAEEALAKIQGGMEFEDAVKQYSDDAGSVDRMGLVGKFHRGDMEPAFSAAAFALRVEQVSNVVETQFGFHIIKRTQ
jgi:NIMA-interacting peptidyl-prolyl cis-trans isomerase 1